MCQGYIYLAFIRSCCHNYIEIQMDTLTYTEITIHFKPEDVPTLHSKDSNKNSHKVYRLYMICKSYIFHNLKKNTL